MVGRAEDNLLLPLSCHGHGNSHHLSPDTDTPKCCSGEDGRAVTTGGPFYQQFLPARKEYIRLHPAQRLVTKLQHERLRHIHLQLQCRGKKINHTTSALTFLCRQTLKRDEL